MTDKTEPIRTVLVTGGAGYIGSVLVPELLSQGYQVIVVDRFFFGMDTLPDHPRLTLQEKDTRCLCAVDFSDIDCVIDLAAISNDPSGEYFTDTTWTINHSARVCTARLARENGVKRYLLPSSCSVYGFSEGSLHEKSPTNPLSHYARANKITEEDILALSTTDFTVAALRLATVFGYSPRMRFDLAVNAMLYSGFTNGVIPVLRDGNQYRPFIHIRDAARAFVHFLFMDSSTINGEIFNIGSRDNTLRLRELAERIHSWLAHWHENDSVLDWYGDPDRRSYYVQFDKSDKIAGFRAKWSLEDGFFEIVDGLKNKNLERTIKTQTLDWYKHLESRMPGALTDRPMETQPFSSNVQSER